MPPVAGARAVDDGDVAGRLPEALEQRPHRGDADARAHEQDLAPGAHPLVQAAVGSLDEDPGALRLDE